MRPQPTASWQTLRERLRLMLANRLTYPKTLLGLGKERLLTEAEIQQAYRCLEECLSFVEAELILFQMQER